MSHKRNWKGVKWIDTAFAKPHKRRIAVRRVFVGMFYAQAYSTIQAIRQSTADKNDKAIAIAKTVIGAHSYAAKMMKHGPEGMAQ